MFMEENLDEAARETAYCLMALNEFDRLSYLTQIDSAGDYLRSVQLETGGWEDYTDAGENNRVTGEALWGILTAESVLGDFDRNGFVDFKDLAVFALAWSAEYGDIQWNPYCEISTPADNLINTIDLGMFVDNWLSVVE
jgi:hypothetical protein